MNAAFRWLHQLTPFLFLLVPVSALGQDPPLRWGGDKAGGAPFIYEEPGKGDVGFEVELAQYLGEKLGRKPEFVQGDWNTIPDTLLRGNIDVALNGYEYLPEREREFRSTLPYFVYSLRLIVNTKDDTVRSWEDLRNAPRKYRVGVLLGTVAERFMKEHFGDVVDVIPTKEVDETFQLVEDGERMDATVQDSPAAAYYVQGGRRPKLKVIGEPVGKGYYVILVRPGDTALREQLDVAIKDARTSGKLESIYRKYGLWDGDQERLSEIHAQPWPPPAELKKGLSIWDIRDKLAKATLYTVALAVCSMPLAILIGIILAVGRMYGPFWLRVPLTAYVEVLRGTPLLLQMFVWFFLLPNLAHRIDWGPLIYLATLPPFLVGVLGLAINYSANEAENYRAGLQAIPRGQLEAALALGMSPATAVRKVVLPQAIRIVIPPVTNDFIALFKDTSICSMILITELTGLYYQYKYDRELVLQLALTIALIYLFLSYPLSVLASRLEKRLSRGAHA